MFYIVVDCGTPVSAGSKAMRSYLNTFYNSIVTYTCTLGYVFSTGFNTMTSICQSNGLWTVIQAQDCLGL